jgi:hypothetical protein
MKKVGDATHWYYRDKGEICVEAGFFMDVVYPRVLEYRMHIPRNPNSRKPGEFDWARTKNFFKDPHDEAIYQKFLAEQEQARLEFEQYRLQSETASAP